MNAPIRATLPPVPARIGRLPRDHRGFPIPWFVEWFQDGKPSDVGVGAPDFRVMNGVKLAQAVRQRRCWTCGQPLGRHMAFVIGPMCAVNRVISEPPSHFECAEFSAKACPFLSQPKMRRNERFEIEVKDGPGFGLKRNPGVACVWVTGSYRPFRADMGNPGTLFQLGPPERVLWYAHGREATRAEVLESINSGFPSLLELAELEGSDAVAALNASMTRAMPLLPADTGAAEPAQSKAPESAR